MLCHHCQEKEATVKIAEMVNGEATERYLCESCAAQAGMKGQFVQQQTFSLQDLLAGLLNLGSSIHNQRVMQQQGQQCPKCHMTYHQFAKHGKAGCEQCYATFEQPLQPLLKRLHGGNTTHQGKIPKRIGGKLQLKREVEKLRHTLQQHIQAEEFEQAALVRDELRRIEKEMNEAQHRGEHDVI